MWARAERPELKPAGSNCIVRRVLDERLALPVGPGEVSAALLQ
ncbi:MAG TPA: hypothetical protein VF544_14720 [Pyrinomonadaceae bacterium]|jgi:hypothetical protein